MSRWLQSVNNLLETLDGRAETVAETVAEVGAAAAGTGAIDNQIGKFLQNGRQAVAAGLNNTTSAAFRNNNSSPASTDDDDDDGEFDDDLESEDEDYSTEYDEADYEDEEVEGEYNSNPPDDDYANTTEDEEELLEEEFVDKTITDDELEQGNLQGEGWPIVESEDDLPPDAGAALEQALLATTNSEDAVSVSVRRRRPDQDDITVSDISFSEYTEEELDDGNNSSTANKNKSSVGSSNPTSPRPLIDAVESADTGTATTGDAPPKTPNRYDSHPGKVVQMAEKAAALASTQHTYETPHTAVGSKKDDNTKRTEDIVPTKGNSPPPPPPPPPPPTTNRTPVSIAKSHALSPKVDESPVPPRRSVDGTRMPITQVDLWDESNDQILRGTVDVPPFSAPQPLPPPSNTVDSGAKTLDDSAPPRLPARKASFPQKKPHQTAASANTATKDPHSTSTPNPHLGSESDPKTTKEAAPNSAPVVVNVKQTKEYQKLKEKLQSLQSQIHKTTTELKTTQTELKTTQTELTTSQTKVQSLQKQLQTMDSKLQVANTEINAQSEELRRAGERMEKDRLRAQEDREDLLDEQEEEIENLREAHQTEMEELRNRYEAQIDTLSKQLQAEETRRRQEGGDFTQELQDAIERERSALKELQSVNNEKSQLQSKISAMQTQQTTLQAKLDSALQAVKTATEREREAEDKLDAALSLHARQTSQRQAREAELEKTIFDLGSALTVARQKQQNSAISKNPPTGETTDEEQLKDKYAAATDELETLKVQLGMETMRREALQEELNEISKERAEEASNAQARQRVHDRKVSDLESTISRLQASLKENKNKQSGAGSDASAPKQSAAELLQELQTAKREIENLSSQLLRHQGMAENSKSEILALKGRLQAATSRAEQAEQSLYAAQASQSTPISTNRLYQMESGGATSSVVRRRVKGGAARTRTRTIRSALQMGPGRTNNACMEQVALTLDALDSWMVETGAFLRHEPLARLGFLLYLMTLHLWTFALVVFHTTEQPHGDFGSMDNNPRHWRAAAAAVQQQP